MTLVCIGVIFLSGLNNYGLSSLIVPVLLLALFGTLQDLEKPKEKLFENLSTPWIHQPHVDRHNPLNWVRWYGVQLVMGSLVFGLPAYIAGRILGTFF